jgi:hypothetical protein
MSRIGVEGDKKIAIMEFFSWIRHFIAEFGIKMMVWLLWILAAAFVFHCREHGSLPFKFFL